MNLPHLQQPQSQPKTKPLGKKALSALSQPIQVRSRQTYPSNIATGLPAGEGLNEVAHPFDPTSSWRTLNVQRKNLLDLNWQTVRDITMDLSPIVNKGYYDFLRFGNPGHLIEGTDRELAGAEVLTKLLSEYYGGFRLHLDTIWSSIFLTGCVFMELVLDEAGRRPLDLVINNSNAAKFVRRRHPGRGWAWTLVKDSGYGHDLEYERPHLIKFLGFDKMPDNPWGRPIIGPAAYSSLFLLGLISDLRRAVANQGLSRLDYELQAEEILNLIDRNPDIAGDDEATAQFIEEHIDQVQIALSGLEPDSDYVHLSTVKVNYATSPYQTNFTGTEGIIGVLRNEIVNGYKGVATLANILDSTTETHGTLQVDYLVSAIQSMQDEIAMTLTEFFNISNRIQGIPSNLTFYFKRQRTADRKVDAEIRAMETDTTIKKLDAGVIDPTEAREEIDGFVDPLQVGI